MILSVRIFTTCVSISFASDFSNLLLQKYSSLDYHKLHRPPYIFSNKSIEQHQLLWHSISYE